MTSRDKPGPGVVVAGAGTRIPGHLTLETLDALSRCDEIFTILTPELAALLPRELAPKMRSLWTYYQPGLRRLEAYAQEIDTILGAAEQNRRVAYLTVGNPVLYDSVTQGLLADGPRRGIDIEVFPAVSAIDAIFTDLRSDIAPGCQIYDASSIVAYQIPLRPDIPCLLLQPDLFGTSYVAIGHEPSPEAMRPLKDYLLKFYPAGHALTYVTSAVTSADSSRLVPFALRDLGGTEEAPQTPGASLFIPAAQDLAPDQAFTAWMADVRSFSESYRKSARRPGRPVPSASGGRDYNAVVLLSGGLDSAVLLHHVIAAHGRPVLALHMTGLGSRCETSAARKVAADAAVDLDVVEMDGIAKACQPIARDKDDEDGYRGILGAAAVYMAAAAYAVAHQIPVVAIGLHGGDAASWVEQSPAFLDLIRATVGMVEPGCEFAVPFHAWSKADVLKRGTDLGIDLSLTWSCVTPASGRQDGTCHACRARRDAFQAAGVCDATDYAGLEPGRLDHG